MSDLVTRLRGWRNWREVHIVRTHMLLEEAATEIERLSQNVDCPDEDNAANRDNTPATHATPRVGSEQSGCTITDAEREAVEQAAIRVESLCQRGSQHMAATLRGLLERMS